MIGWLIPLFEQNLELSPSQASMDSAKTRFMFSRVKRAQCQVGCHRNSKWMMVLAAYPKACMIPRSSAKPRIRPISG